MRYQLLYAVTRTIVAVLYHAGTTPPIDHVQLVSPESPEPGMVLVVVVTGLTPLHAAPSLVSAPTAVPHNHPGNIWQKKSRKNIISCMCVCVCVCVYLETEPEQLDGTLEVH